MPDRYLGRQIGKYRVIRLLGVGAFAWVYEAIDRDLEIPVALKILRPEFAGNPDAETRFRREATTAARLRHPNIVTVRDVGQADGASFVAMDLHPLSLARRLELVRRLPEPEVVRIGLDVAAALAIAHAGGIIHRDIKPDNILIGPAGEAVVADFGLARALSSDSSISATNQVMGTPHYFSPEQARGQEIDGRSDLYALGVTLFRAATGRLPFEGDDWYAVAKQHVEDPPPAPSTLVPDVSPEFERIMLRLLAKRPESRYESAIALADALATLPTAPIDRGSVLTPHSSSQTVVDFQPDRLSLAEARRRRARRVGAVAATVAVAALLWGAQQRGLLPASLGGGLGPSRPGDSLSATLPGDSGARTGAQNGVPPSLADSALRDSLDLAAGRPPAATSGTVPTAPRPRPEPPRKVPVALAAPESAALYVNGELVGRGSWAGDLEPAARVTFQAVITDQSQVDCQRARRTVTQRLSPGRPLDLTLDVRSCTGVVLDVVPVDARLVFEPLDGGERVEARADVRPAFSMATGKYRVSAQAPRCNAFSDSWTLERTAEPKRIRIRMTCP